MAKKKKKKHQRRQPQQERSSFDLFSLDSARDMVEKATGIHIPTKKEVILGTIEFAGNFVEGLMNPRTVAPIKKFLGRVLAIKMSLQKVGGQE